jgi:two-component system, NtrC family, sensor kinase
MVLLDISILTRVIIGIAAMVLLFTSFLVVFINSQRKKLQYHKDLQAIQEEQRQELVKQNALLEVRVEERTAELQEQKDSLQNALAQLKSSQLQLIQKEKMASLGELTAGIAHEIQNPLNFVNNFSEINSELMAELKERLGEEQLPGSLKIDIDPLIKDLDENLLKVSVHGKRADSIVKNMLQHSRKQTGDMEPTDLNALAEEYLKLSYQGYRAKHKSFNCKIETFFDPALSAGQSGAGEINLIPEEIGRILINLFNNSFYSTNEKKNQLGDSFVPLVSLTTKKNGDKASVIVRDNGLGISPKFTEKIYHPFFTTKPPGEGTGLGLSMSYDIIKAHGGNLSVDSVEGVFATFTIELNC